MREREREKETFVLSAMDLGYSVFTFVTWCQ